MKNSTEKQDTTIVDAPAIGLNPDEQAGDVLLNFYKALGWNGEDYLDPQKVRTTEEVFNRLKDAIYELAPDPVGIGMLMVNIGPGADDHIEPNKVHLLMQPNRQITSPAVLDGDSPTPWGVAFSGYTNDLQNMSFLIARPPTDPSLTSRQSG